jgi:hypothetical protein
MWTFLVHRSINLSSAKEDHFRVLVVVVVVLIVVRGGGGGGGGGKGGSGSSIHKTELMKIIL